ncbi:MAG: tryptophan-rich sensory protein [Oscillospiraceae bacterium]|jgi:tryptophan-rich sensory protein|nr:tryptophan-rich sensory protein [Oscillospiraceae bacterium]
MSGRRTALHFFLAALTGALASLFTVHMGERFALLKTPFLFPPVSLLPVGWAVSLLLAAAAIRPADPASGDGQKAMRAFYLSLALILLWPVFFFRLDAKAGGAAVLLLLTGVLLHARKLIGPGTGQKLLVPCCLWTGYLSYLNIGICLLN